MWWRECVVALGVLSSAALALGELPEQAVPPVASASVEVRAEADVVAQEAVRAVDAALTGEPLALASTSSGAVLGVPAAEGTWRNPWPHFAAPASGPAQSIGSYVAGCLQGAEALPLDGPGYQVMRPSRNRYYGHPELIDYVRGLGRGVNRRGHGVVLVGDLSQPRGGRASSGHTSHQTGLDVDVWFWRPQEALRGALSSAARELLEAQSILSPFAEVIHAPWKSHIAGVLRLAAEDRRVDRVFVHPSIKRELCESTQGDRGFLRKLRPWYGHDDHFHARLMCPATDPACKAQAPLPQGDGCDQLSQWFSAQPRPVRDRQLAASAARAAAKRKVPKRARWPMRCDELL